MERLPDHVVFICVLLFIARAIWLAPVFLCVNCKHTRSGRSSVSAICIFWSLPLGCTLFSWLCLLHAVLVRTCVVLHHRLRECGCGTGPSCKGFWKVEGKWTIWIYIARSCSLIALPSTQRLHQVDAPLWRTGCLIKEGGKGFENPLSCLGY